MASAEAPVIGMTRSMQPSSLSVSNLLSKTPACSLLVLFGILPTLHWQTLLHLLCLASMSMTSFTSLKTLPSKLYSVVSWLSNAKLISWAWWNGFSEFILHGASRPTPSRFTSINRVLLQILSRTFFRHFRNVTSTATPYRSGVPIDSTAPSTDDDDSPAQLQRTAAYQSLIGSIGWLSTSTRPDLSAVHSFLASYSNKPSAGHMKAALYALHYIHSTHDYGISFTSDSVAPMHSYIHFPPSTDVEAYTNALPPTLTNSSTLSSYSDACWGS